MSLQVVVAPMRQKPSCAVTPRSSRMPVTSSTASRIACALRAAYRSVPPASIVNRSAASARTASATVSGLK
jgi:hypothetical protein